MQRLRLTELIPYFGIVGAFLFGLIPFDLILARLLKRPKENLWPTVFFSTLLSIGKGTLVIFIFLPTGTRLWGDLVSLSGYSVSMATLWCMTLSGVVGSCYSSRWIGKTSTGITVALGAALLLSPVSALVGAAAYLLAWLTARKPSVSSISAIIVGFTSQIVLEPVGAHSWIIAVIVFIVIARQNKNIDDLLEYRENSI